MNVVAWGKLAITKGWIKSRQFILQHLTFKVQKVGSKYYKVDENSSSASYD